MAEYEVDSKDLIAVVSKCLGVISLGDKAESNSITLIFDKKGIVAEAVNTVASYQSALVAKVVKAGSMRMHILPELLLSYAKAHKTLTLSPNEQNLKVTSGKNFSAEIYFIGDNESVEIDKPKQSDDIEKVATAVSSMLSMVSGVRNRTDGQTLAVMTEWGEQVIELTIGDTHHAVVIDHAIKEKVKGKIIMDLSNMSRIMSVGQHFAATESRFIAWSDTEYLSIANQSESVFVADAARTAIKDAKKQTKVEVSTQAFTSMVDTLTSAVDETSTINFKIEAKRILASVKTGASSAKHQMKVEGFKGKEVAVSVAIHHLKDCLSTMKDKTMNITVFNNMLALESKNKLIQCVAAMAAVGSKQ